MKTDEVFETNFEGRSNDEFDNDCGTPSRQSSGDERDIDRKVDVAVEEVISKVEKYIRGRRKYPKDTPPE